MRLKELLYLDAKNVSCRRRGIADTKTSEGGCGWEKEPKPTSLPECRELSERFSFDNTSLTVFFRPNVEGSTFFSKKNIFSLLICLTYLEHCGIFDKLRNKG